jgi:DNA-binding CsgD family transcriptional regulator
MTRERLTTRAERAAACAVKRACHAGLDSVALREEVVRRSAAVVPTDACSVVATDPDTGLFVHGWLEQVPERLVERYMAELYPREAADYLDLAHSGRVITTRNSRAFLAMLNAEGLAYRARTALCTGDGIWGSWCLFRERGSPGFGEREARFLRVIAPHIGAGMRSAALMEAACGDALPGAPGGPGVVVLDEKRRITMRSSGSGALLEDLASVGASPALLPYAVMSLLSAMDLAAARTGGLAAVEVRAPGRSGRWYTLRSTRTEPDADHRVSTVVIIEPTTHPSRGRALGRLYGLTARETEVLRLVLRGDSNKKIAVALKLSHHTVQDHVSHACAKVGVRGRRALLARLYQDGFTAAPLATA